MRYFFFFNIRFFLDFLVQALDVFFLIDRFLMIYTIISINCSSKIHWKLNGFATVCKMSNSKSCFLKRPKGCSESFFFFFRFLFSSLIFNTYKLHLRDLSVSLCRYYFLVNNNCGLNYTQHAYERKRDAVVTQQLNCLCRLLWLTRVKTKRRRRNKKKIKID